MSALTSACSLIAALDSQAYAHPLHEEEEEEEAGFPGHTEVWVLSPKCTAAPHKGRMSQSLMQTCLWHGWSLGLPQQWLDHVVASHLLYKSILGAGRREKPRSVCRTQNAASSRTTA